MSSKKMDRAEILLAPPGFISHTAFTLKKVATDKDVGKCTSSRKNSRSEFPVQALSSMDYEVIRADLKLNTRPWIIHAQAEDCEEQPDFELSHKLPDRQNREGASSLSLEEAPVFHPTDKDFEDTLKYIDSIRARVKPYGFCRIVPPSSWQPPCLFKLMKAHQNFKFTTQVQRINEFEKREELSSDNAKLKRQRISETYIDNESSNRCSVNCDAVGFQQAGMFKFESGPEFTLDSFMKYANDFKECHFSRKSENSCSGVRPKLVPGHWEPSEVEVEDKYRQVLEKSTDKIEVLCGSSNSRFFKNEYPRSYKTDEASISPSHLESGWNLNNISKLTGSLLSLEESSSSLGHCLHFGMCFSTHPWKVEDHHLYALYYLHTGASKIWYGVPEDCFPKFEAVVKKLFPQILPHHHELFGKLPMQISPEILLSEAIPVHRTIQRSGEFVLFLPGAYYSGVGCGFNCLEHVKFATFDWLPHGHGVVQMYRQMGKKTKISYDKLLLRASYEAVKGQYLVVLRGKKTPANLRWKDACGKDKFLAKALKNRVKQEERLREFLSTASQWEKMDKCFNEDVKKECWLCYFDLYLSASYCRCNPNKFSCLWHTKYLCSCGWSHKVFLYRYQISELNLLVEAVGEKLTSAYKWVSGDFGQDLEPGIYNGGNTNVLTKDPPLGEASRTGKDETKNIPSPCLVVKDDINKLVSESMARILRASSMDDLKSKGIDMRIDFTSNDLSEDSGNIPSSSDKES